jgi:hypothetical protein
MVKKVRFGIKKRAAGVVRHEFDDCILHDPPPQAATPFLPLTAAPSGLGHYFAGGDNFLGSTYF